MTDSEPGGDDGAGGLEARAESVARMLRTDGPAAAALRLVRGQWQSMLVTGGSVHGRAAFAGGAARVLADDARVLAIGPEALVAGSQAVAVDCALDPADRGESSAGALLRAALRQDPDALLVVEPEPEALATVLQAMLTGASVILVLGSGREAALAALRAAAAETLGLGEDAFRGIVAAQLAAIFELESDGGRDRLAAVHLWDAPRNSYGAIVERVDGALRTTAQAFDAAAGRVMDPAMDPAVDPAVDPAAGAENAAEAGPATGSPSFPEPMQLDDVEPLGEPVLQRLERIYGKAQRTCFVPRLGGNAPAASASKFGGAAMVGPGDGGWPRARATGNPMQLVFQLRVETLPDAVQERLGATSGWWQFFYDPTSSFDGEPWAGFAGFDLVRVLPSKGAVPCEEPEGIDRAHAYGAREVLGWTALTDAPHGEDLGAAAAPFGEPEEVLAETFLRDLGFDDLRLVREDSPRAAAYRETLRPLFDWLGLGSTDELERALEFLWNRGGDKLLGWPAWAQGPEVPRDPDSGAPMLFLAQISANGVEDPLIGERGLFPGLFAGDGTGQIFQSADDPSRMTFVWACG